MAKLCLILDGGEFVWMNYDVNDLPRVSGETIEDAIDAAKKKWKRADFQVQDSKA